MIHFTQACQKMGIHWRVLVEFAGGRVDFGQAAGQPAMFTAALALPDRATLEAVQQVSAELLRTEIPAYSMPGGYSLARNCLVGRVQESLDFHTQ